jgi:magnesium-transporting ATPase (P-type)
MGRIECELPNDDLKTFVGSMNADENLESIGIKQFLPSGAVLKNTKWIIGCAVFTGDDTKLRQNSKSGRLKMSKIEKLLNSYILAVMGFQMVLCIIIAISAGSWA